MLKMHSSCIYGIVLCCVVIIIINDNYFQALACLEEEKIALIKLNDKIQLPGWDNDQEVDCCSWSGVTCNPVSKRIITFFIQVSPIENTTSPFDASLLQPFEELQNLTFNNGQTDVVKGPAKLPKLQVLDLGYNGLISHIPFVGEELPSLRFLYLNNNDFSYDVFKELTTLSSLELLNLRRNDFQNQIPPSIWTFTSLKMLSLSYNKFNGSLPEGLCALTNLEELDLSNNDFQGAIPACLSNLTSLRLLDLSQNKFSGSIPSNIFPRLKSLEYLSLSGNQFDLFSFSSFADHSKLEVFRLESDNPNLKVETENAQWKPPIFQLKLFTLSNCILNEPTRVIPSFLLSQYDLRVVGLSDTGITGDFPSWLLTNNSRLEILNLKHNRLSGQLMLQLDKYNADMSLIDISMNQVAGEIPTFIGSFFPNLYTLNMSTNSFEGNIPSSFVNMTRLQSLDLSNNHLSGEFHGDLFTGCMLLDILKLSNNNLEGNLTNFFLNILGLDGLSALYLDNNNFSGNLRLETLRLPLASIGVLDISNNSITGRFPDWITELSLATLDLSKNNFQGKLPTSFCKFIHIRVLDLSFNNFSDTLPPCTNLSMLQLLHLQGNGFHGPLPISLSRSSTMVTLDVRDNKFSGLIPAWIGSLSNLAIILLKGNSFHGSIPSELCQMKNLMILDFSANNLSGHVPHCLSRIHFGNKTDLPTLVEYGEGTYFELHMSEYSYRNLLDVGLDFPGGYGASDVPDEVQLITKSLSESYTGNILYSMSAIDLSFNRLTGPIPMHIGSWEHVQSLNLSYNHFNGSIPMDLTSLVNLESLDLSHNMLTGQIPSLVTKLNFLTVFSVAYNNLSGSTPTRINQFGTFEAISYEGNPFLCGPPLDKSCSGIPMKIPHAKLLVEPQQNDSSFKTLFLWSFFGSFIVSCIGAFVFFYFGTNIPQIALQWMGIEERIRHRRTVELPWKLINR